MHRIPLQPTEEFEELRRLLLSPEQEQLCKLSERISSNERRSSDVAAILPEAVKLSRSRGEDLSRALGPSVEDSIKYWIEKEPNAFVDTLRPVTGRLLWRWVERSVRHYWQLLNRPLGHVFSLRRLEPIYRVEELFLIHRETGSSLLHLSADPARDGSSNIKRDTLNAIQEFTRNSVRQSTDSDSALIEFRVAGVHIWTALGPYAYLAAVIRGTPSAELGAILEKTIRDVHMLKDSAIANFTGDAAPFRSLRPELKSCLRSEDREMKRTGPAIFAWAVLAVAAGLTAFAGFQAVHSQSKWENFLLRLNVQPGLVVTDAWKGWFSNSHVSGLCDPLAADPAAIAREEKLDPARIDFRWKEYLANDPEIAMKRFKHRFGMPSGARAAVRDGTLMLSGSVPYEWLERVRGQATLLPGFASLIERNLQVTYDPGSVLARFKEKFGLPDTVHAVLAKGSLNLSGAARHAWMSRVRSEANKVPGIDSVDARNVIDLDQQALDQSRAIIENTFVYFVPDKDEIATEGFTALARLPEQLNRLMNAARQIGANLTLEIHGYDGDAAAANGSAESGLGQRRADKVRDFLVSCGFQLTELRPIGMKQPPSEASAGQAIPEQSESSVSFSVVISGSPGLQ